MMGKHFGITYGKYSMFKTGINGHGINITK